MVAAAGRAAGGAVAGGRRPKRTPKRPSPELQAWFEQQLGVPPGDLEAFLARAPSLSGRTPQSLQANLAALQGAVGAQQAQQLVRKQPALLTMSRETVQAALAWLLRAFGGDAARLLAVLERGPHLLAVPPAKLQARADYLQRQLGWQAGDGQPAAFVEAFPQSFATIALDGAETQAKLLLLTRVLGLEAGECLSKYSTYLKYSLELLAARYVLVQVGGWVGACVRACVRG